MQIQARDLTQWITLALLALLLWVARGALPPFIIAGILAYILSPLADELAQRTGLRRTPAALVVFGAVLALLLLLGWLAEVRLVREIRSLTAEGAGIVATAVQRLTGGQDLDLLGQRMTAAELAARLNLAMAGWVGSPAEALHVVRIGLELGLSTLLALLALAYLLVDGHRLGAYLLRFVPPEHRGHLRHVLREVHQVLGRYLRGQLILIVLMSTATFLVLELIFRLPYALWIAILTGFLEIIPLLGPVTAGAIAAVVGFSQGGPTEAAWIALAYFVLRQVEDQLVMPVVVGRAVHLHPLVTVFAVLAAERVAGVLGMLLAVPFAAAAKVTLDYAYPPADPDQESSRGGRDVVEPHALGPPEDGRAPEEPTIPPPTAAGAGAVGPSSPGHGVAPG